MNKLFWTGLCLIISLIPFSSKAKGKLDIMFGMYSLTAQTSTASSSISNFGSYLISYRYPFLTHLEMLIGYSLIASKIYTGDLGFGPDIGMVYFPFTSSAPISASSDNINLKIQEFYKPYVGVAFHQRQYQSTQSTYAGFSWSGGSEIYISDKYTLKAEVRAIRLLGPSNSSATEIDILGGVSFNF